MCVWLPSVSVEGFLEDANFPASYLCQVNWSREFELKTDLPGITKWG